MKAIVQIEQENDSLTSKEYNIYILDHVSVIVSK